MQWNKRTQTLLAALTLAVLSGSLSGCESKCPLLNESECKDTKGCRTLFGWNKEKKRKYAGCVDSSGISGTAETCAAPEKTSVDCLRFSTTLIPDSWEEVSCDDRRCPESKGN